MPGGLPEGWTLDRVWAESRCPDAALLDTETTAAVETRRGGSGPLPHREVRPTETVLDVEGLFLVRFVGDVDWLVGQRDDDLIVCWASYGPDLGEAIRAL
jgi:hypothetical protein